MNESRLFFSKYFFNLRKHSKWLIKLIITIIVFSLSNIVNVFATDLIKVYKENGIPTNQIDQTVSTTKLFTITTSPFLSLIVIFIFFVIFLLISTLMNSDINSKTIFSATLSFLLVTKFISLVILSIQWIVGISTTDYIITSLNIFDKGNQLLGAFNLQTIANSYIFSVMLYSTNNLSKFNSFIWGIIYIIVSIVSSIIAIILY